MVLQKVQLIPFFLSGLFLFLDQIVKYFFLHHQNFSFYLIKPWLGLEYFQNPGIAFGLSVPNWLILFLTPFVLFIILLFLFQKNPSPQGSLALTLILGGAISNFIDRIFFDFTIDYIRLVTSIVNIADGMIVVGTGMIVFGEIGKKLESRIEE